MIWENQKAKFKDFMEKEISFLREINGNFKIEDYKIDHACLRFRNKTDVDSLVTELINGENKIISSAIVNNRTIYIIKLKDPLGYNNNIIECLELPHPTTNHDFPEDGWEHIEIILKTNNKEDSLEAVFKNTFNKIGEKYQYKVSTPTVSGEKILNTTITIEKEKGLAVKFHEHPIEEIVTTK